MKTLTRLLVAAILVAGLIPVSVFAQTKSKRTSRQVHKKEPAPVQAHAYTSRGIRYETKVQHVYDSGAADGVKVAVLKYKDGDWTGIGEGEKFKEGDRVKVQFVSNFNGYVYLVNVMPNGGKRVLFPYPGKASNIVSSGGTYLWPEIGQWVFDDKPGTEVIQVILSKEPVPIYDEAVKRPNGELEESAVNAAAQLSASVPKKKDSGLIAQNTSLRELPGYQTRSLKYGPGKDKNNKETVAVVSTSDTNVTPVKLVAKEVAALEIQLDHVAK